jgi:hypothetical protein
VGLIIHEREIVTKLFCEKTIQNNSRFAKGAQSMVGLSLLAQDIWSYVEFTLKRIWTQLNMHVEETTSTGDL